MSSVLRLRLQRNIGSGINSFEKTQTLVRRLALCRYTTHPTSLPNQNLLSSSEQSITQNNVAIFWDLDNKPPKSIPPYEAALRLKRAAQRFGFVKHLIACANRHSFSYIPPSVRDERRAKRAQNELETMGFVKPDEPYVCRVCGRRFYSNDRLVNHFKQIHERENSKRLNQIESSRGKRRANLVAKYSLKMEKYKNAARDVLTPRVGYGLADEIQRAGFRVKTASNKPQATDIALRDEMIDMMDKRRVDCLFLVSDDSDFIGVLKEAKERCLKTAVVGDCSSDGLKRVADAAFSWNEILIGKAKKEAVSVVGKWNDRNALQRLEWSYDPQTEKGLYVEELETGEEDSDVEFFSFGEKKSLVNEDDDEGSWYELDSD